MILHTFEERSTPSNHATRSIPIQYKISEAGCWECVSHKKDQDGYVRLTRDKKNIYLHRLVYAQEVEEIPKNMVILHSCDNPSCMNPSHLSVGTNRENQLDKVRKNRQAKGSQNGRSKLTEEQVVEIRKDSRTAKELSQAYGVSDAMIYDIKNYKFWRSVQ